MAWLASRSSESGSAVGRDGRPRADVEEVGDRFDAGVVDEAAGAGTHVVAFARRSLDGVRWQQARHPKQRLAEAVLDDALVIGKDQRLAVAGIDVEIEQETGAVAGREALEPVRHRLRIAVGRVAVGDVQHRRRERRRMRRTPLLENVDRGIKPGAHCGLPPTVRLEPDRKAHRLLGNVAIRTRDLLGPSLDAQRGFGEAGNDVQRFLAERALESVARVLAAIRDDADVEVVAHAVRLRAAGDDRIKRLVEHVGEECGLALPAVEPLAHRRRLVDHHQDRGRRCPADFRLITHGPHPSQKSARGPFAHASPARYRRNAHAAETTQMPTLELNPSRTPMNAPRRLWFHAGNKNRAERRYTDETWAHHADEISDESMGVRPRRQVSHDKILRAKRDWPVGPGALAPWCAKSRRRTLTTRSDEEAP